MGNHAGELCGSSVRDADLDALFRTEAPQAEQAGCTSVGGHAARGQTRGEDLLLVGDRCAGQGVHAPVHDPEPTIFLPMLNLTVAQIGGSKLFASTESLLIPGDSSDAKVGSVHGDHLTTGV